MEKVRRNILAVLNIVRLSFIRFSKNIKWHGRQFISLKCDLEVDKGGEISIDRWMQVEKYSRIAVRSKGHIGIGKNVYINRNCNIISRNSIEIGDNVTIGPNCCIYDHDHSLYKRGDYTSASIIIKENVWIGSGVTVLKGVVIGKNAVIAAGSVVVHDVPDNAVLYQKREDVYKNKV